ncbi:MAG: Uma2 family endonuclease [Pseudomonadota bacterium]
MSETLERTATYQDVIDAPPNVVAEIVDGRLQTHPRPAPRHAVAHSVLGAKLTPPYQFGENEGPGGWLIVDEPELHLGPSNKRDVVVPDIAAWRRERLPKLPDTSYFETPPDWVCEVISPSTARLDRGPKRDIYAREGINHLWLVDPIEQILEAFELRDGQWTLLKTLKDEDQVVVAPFEVVPFPLKHLWAE